MAVLPGFIEVCSMLWDGLLIPLAKIVLLISFGLLLANFIEALNWTHAMARLASPLIRVGHLSDVSGASFSMAFFSGVSANTMLAEGFDQGRIGRRELILANLFNSLPTYFLHLPTVFFITAPLIKGAAVIYVGLTFGAAVLRTIFVLLVGRLWLTPRSSGDIDALLASTRKNTWREAAARAGKRFKKRIRKILFFTVPIYSLIFLLNKFGLFNLLQDFISRHLGLFSWLHPESVGIIVLHVAAEFTAGLAMAGALLDSGSLSYREVVLALLAGNVLSSPMRALRHQFPYYAGIFPPSLAVQLVCYNQFFRVGSIVLVGLTYYFLT